MVNKKEIFVGEYCVKDIINMILAVTKNDELWQKESFKKALDYLQGEQKLGFPCVPKEKPRLLRNAF